GQCFCHFEDDIHPRQADVIGEIGADTKGIPNFTFTICAYSFHLTIVQTVRENDGFGAWVNTFARIVCDDFFGEFNRVTTIVSYTVKKLGQLLVKLAEKSFGSVGVRQGDTEITSVDFRPMLQTE